MTTSLMMKDIPITKSDYSSYSDEYLFGMIIDNYYQFRETNIRRFWRYSYLFDFDNEDIEDINENNNLNLFLIKTYAPDIYNTYEYDKYDNFLTTRYMTNLELCADIIHRRFNDRFFKHINDLEADELSGAETETDE